MSAAVFRLVTPNMKSSAIHAFQESLNATFAEWRVPKTIDADSEYGEETDLAARQVCHGLGINPQSYGNGMTPGVRIKIRHPEKRTPAEIAVGNEREEWRRAFAKRVSAEAAGPEAAVKFARKNVGVSESPPGSNRGQLIDMWNRAVGTTPGPQAYWCGAFVNACLHAAGFPNQPFLAYCPGIETHARGGAGGWSWHPTLADGKPGDLVLYTEPGSGVAAHVELVVSARPFDVIGGNTSANPSTGSQSNGGCVAEHRRDPNNPGLKFKGYARPPWKA
jgi:hypothetical protein